MQKVNHIYEVIEKLEGLAARLSTNAISEQELTDIEKLMER
ncbi:hypothetical protein [Gracilibacillus caseinilyticus]|nr:hypothetical protein [Gracilibacillus caseinilyticus]